MFLYSLNDSDIRLNSMFLWGVNCNFLFPFSFCGKPSGLRHREGTRVPAPNLGPSCDLKKLQMEIPQNHVWKGWVQKITNP